MKSERLPGVAATAVIICLAFAFAQQPARGKTSYMRSLNHRAILVDLPLSP